jgi:Fur family ferric uptake transcriptional regulator
MNKAPRTAALPQGRMTTTRAGEPGRDAAEEKRNFAAFLATRKLKLTRQREAVLDEILNNPGHFEAEEIVQRLKANRQRVSRATVYRTLDLMKECLLVERLDFGTQAAYYEHVQEGEHHDHLICTHCGNVIEFHNDELEAIQSAVCRNFDFHERYHSLRIFGLCSKCHRIHS